MIYILIAAFVLYALFIEWRVRVSFSNVKVCFGRFEKYISNGTQARNSIDERVGALQDTVQDNYDNQGAFNERIAKRLDLIEGQAANATLLESLSRKTLKSIRERTAHVSLPKNFGVVKADKTEALRLKRRDAMRRYRAAKKATKIK